MRKLTKNVMINVTDDIEKFGFFIKDGTMSKEIVSYVKSCNHADDNINEDYFLVNYCNRIHEFALSLPEGTVIKNFSVVVKEDYLKLTILLEDSSLIILAAIEDSSIKFLLETVRELFLYSEVI